MSDPPPGGEREETWAEGKDPDEWPSPIESPEAAKARRVRNVALGVGLVIFAVIVFLVTIVRLGGHVTDKGF